MKNLKSILFAIAIVAAMFSATFNAQAQTRAVLSEGEIFQHRFISTRRTKSERSSCQNNCRND